MLLHNGEPGLNQGSGGGADITESLAEGLAVRVAVVDPLADHGNLEVRQAEMKAQAGQVTPAELGVGRRDLLRIREAGWR